MRKLSGGLIALITIIAVLSGLALTNPSTDEFAEWVSAHAMKDAEGESFLDALGMLLGKPMVKSMTIRHNFLVFSTFEVGDTEFLGICKQFIPMEYLRIPSVKLVVEDNKKSKNTNSKASSVKPSATPSEPPKKELPSTPTSAPTAKPDVYIDNVPYTRAFDSTYDYTYLYPTDMVLSYNVAGRQMYYSKDGNAKMEVYAINHTNMQQELTQLINSFGGVQTYRADGETWLARSYQNDTNGRALYIKINIVNGSFLRCFTFEEPQSERYIYSKYIEVIEDNLKQKQSVKTLTEKESVDLVYEKLKNSNSFQFRLYEPINENGIYGYILDRGNMEDSTDRQYERILRYEQLHENKYHIIRLLSQIIDNNPDGMNYDTSEGWYAVDMYTGEIFDYNDVL